MRRSPTADLLSETFLIAFRRRPCGAWSSDTASVTVHVPLPEDVAPLDEVRKSVMGPVGPRST